VEKKQKHFIQKPVYPGGDKALTEFIYKQLRYPESALSALPEGTVLVEYDIDYQGNVTDTRVLKGIGHGCDEEACRVVRLLKFQVGKNRGVHVVFHQKAKIQFKKPVPQPQPVAPLEPAAAANFQVQYVITPAEPANNTNTEHAPNTTNYHYTIQL
jgi:TonB family protein